MKIAIIVSSKNTISPSCDGGVETSVYYLAKELVRRGQGITLLAAPGSAVGGVDTVPMSPFPTTGKLSFANLEERVTSFYDLDVMADFFHGSELDRYDLVHYNNYIFYEILPFVKHLDIPTIVRINYPHAEIYQHMKDKLKEYKNVRYLPVSDFIKSAMPGLPYLETVYPAVDFQDFPLSENHGEYLLFMGRICPDKGAHIAVEAARKTGSRLVIAGSVDGVNREYFNRTIKPYVDNERITYVGEADFKTKVKIYRKAIATLFPVQWDEPFGLVPVESMACGTPVIAFDRAAMREVITPGKNGLLVEDGNINRMAEAAAEIAGLDRKNVRETAEKKFAVRAQAERYEKIVGQLL